MLNEAFTLVLRENRGNDSGGSRHPHHTGFEALGDNPANSSSDRHGHAGSVARASIGRSIALLAQPAAAAQHTSRARPAFTRFSLPRYALSTVRHFAYRRPVLHVATDIHARALPRRDCVALPTAVACSALPDIGSICGSTIRLQATVRCPAARATRFATRTTCLRSGWRSAGNPARVRHRRIVISTATQNP